MVHINIVCIGKIKETYLKDAIDEYSKRLSKYCVLNIIELTDEVIPNNASLADEQKIVNLILIIKLLLNTKRMKQRKRVPSIYMMRK